MSNDFIIQRKKRGIYYTPPEASKILCEWAIRNSDDKILEPSFGACGFLESSCARLSELDNPSPSLQLYGCDIDSTAFNGYLRLKFSDPEILKRFIEGDFLEKKTTDFPVSEFDVVFGNPPYVSHHNMSAAQKASCTAIAPFLSCNIGNRASLWAYFVLHGLHFLKKGGRIAWILPSGFLHAKYAVEIKKYISENFSRSMVIQVGQRLFAAEGTEESTAMLLAEGWRSEGVNQNLKIEFAKTLAELKSIISEWKDNRSENKDYKHRSAYSLLDAKSNEVLAIIEREKKVIRLGDALEILIGIVTGDNQFFIVDEQTADHHKLSAECLTPIFSRFTMARGVSFSKQDLQQLRDQNFRCLLVDSSRTKVIQQELENYLALFPETKKQSNVTFKKRKIWHRPDDGRMPLAFFSYMHHQGPRLVINDADVTCTNTIHRVFAKKNETGEPSVSAMQLKLLSLSLQTTYSQLSAELEGRVYGSGALKHEPSEVKRIKVLFNSELTERQINRAYKTVDSLFRSGRSDDARKIADKLLLGGLNESVDRQIIPILEAALIEARARRYDVNPVKKKRVTHSLARWQTATTNSN